MSFPCAGHAQTLSLTFLTPDGVFTCLVTVFFTTSTLPHTEQGVSGRRSIASQHPSFDAESVHPEGGVVDEADAARPRNNRDARIPEHFHRLCR